MEMTAEHKKKLLKILLKLKLILLSIGWLVLTFQFTLFPQGHRFYFSPMVFIWAGLIPIVFLWGIYWVILGFKQKPTKKDLSAE